MEKRPAEFKVGMLWGFLIACAIFVIGLVLVSFVIQGTLPEYNRVAYPSNVPADVEELSRRVDGLENEIATTMRDVAWRMDQKLIVVSWTALAISAIAALVGIQSLTDMRKMANATLQEAFDEAVYDINPTNIPIYLPINQGMEVVQKRLKLSKFKNIDYYRNLEDAPRNGVIIVKLDSKPIDKENPRPLTKQEKNFLTFLKKGNFDPEETAFILFAGTGSVPSEVMHAYENLAIANIPVTIANMVFVVGRGLKKKQDE